MSTCISVFLPSCDALFGVLVPEGAVEVELDFVPADVFVPMVETTLVSVTVAEGVVIVCDGRLRGGVVATTIAGLEIAKRGLVLFMSPSTVRYRALVSLSHARLE